MAAPFLPALRQGGVVRFGGRMAPGADSIADVFVALSQGDQRRWGECCLRETTLNGRRSAWHLCD